MEADALADAVGGAITAQQDAVGRYQADGPVYKVTAQGRLGDDQQTSRAFALRHREDRLNRAGGIGAACRQLDDLGPRAREKHADRGIRDGALVGVSEEHDADRGGQAWGPAILPEEMHLLSAERASQEGVIEGDGQDDRGGREQQEARAPPAGGVSTSGGAALSGSALCTRRSILFRISVHYATPEYSRVGEAPFGIR